MIFDGATGASQDTPRGRQALAGVEDDLVALESAPGGRTFVENADPSHDWIHYPVVIRGATRAVASLHSAAWTVTVLTPEALAAAVADLDGWEVADGCLRREVKLADFRDAFAFMTRVAFDAEELNHHPDWSNVWNRVTINLSTHDAGGITELDLELARRISSHVA